MALVTATINAAADGAAATITHASLHTADPGATGASEAAGGTYARQALTWAPASGTNAVAAQVTLDVPAGTFTHFGLWSALTAGTFRGGNTLSTSEVFAAPGQLKLTVTLDGSPV